MQDLYFCQVHVMWIFHGILGYLAVLLSCYIPVRVATRPHLYWCKIALKRAICILTLRVTGIKDLLLYTSCHLLPPFATYYHLLLPFATLPILKTAYFADFCQKKKPRFFFWIFFADANFQTEFAIVIYIGVMVFFCAYNHSCEKMPPKIL